MIPRDKEELWSTLLKGMLLKGWLAEGLKGRLSASNGEKPGRTTEEEVTANGSQTMAAQ